MSKGFSVLMKQLLVSISRFEDMLTVTETLPKQNMMQCKLSLQVLMMSKGQYQGKSSEHSEYPPWCLGDIPREDRHKS